MTNWESKEGAPFPQGVTWVEEELAYNFSLYSKYADSVTLLIYGKDDFVNPIFTYKLDPLVNKSWRNWHCRIEAEKVKDAQFYAYKVSGPKRTKHHWHAFDPDKVLLDPFARSVFFPPGFDRDAARKPGPNDGKAPLGRLDGFHPSPVREKVDRHESTAVIYEMHVKGFTRNPNSGVSKEKLGTYAGVIEKIPYLKELGVTIVELMPVFQYDPQEGNYWGYMTLNFFSPHQGYNSVSDYTKRRAEFRAMVKALHDAGMEVILDVVYNHTCEGDIRGPTYSYKGIDNYTYYCISENDANPYTDFTGTGNSLHFGNGHVRKMIVESLSYWVREMHIDGFRFDLASVFSRRLDGSLNLEDPPIFGGIVSDPNLEHVRFIAEPWDAVGGGYLLGKSFPAVRWFQWNGQFRDDVRRFVKGDGGMVPALMQRIYGSDSLFPDDIKNSYHAYQSINFVTSHDGFTLYDLVSYNNKRNLANRNNNTDGTNDNYSWNCGCEGDEGVTPDVLKLRKQQAKNCCCILFLSNGTPMFHSGDEFLKTQGGNNNPYNQDNETSWLDWDRLKANADFFRFFKKMIAFRKAHPSLCRSRYWREDIWWYGTGKQVDMGENGRSLAFCLRGASQNDNDIYVMINADSKDLEFTVQERNVEDWKIVLDTSKDSPEDFCNPDEEIPIKSKDMKLKARSIVVLLGAKLKGVGVA